MSVQGKLLFMFIVGVVTCPGVNANSAESTDIGSRIYHQGIGENGQPIEARGIGGTLLTATQAACATCHRRSGYGSSEGGMLAPPVIGKLLFTERDFHYRELKRNMSRPITRPPYNSNLLNRALQKGIAANGKQLQSLMPRYTLTQSEMAHLVSYLKSMGKQGSVGVDDENIYLASVIAPGVPENLKQSMLATLQTYVENKNAETREENERSKKSPWYRSWKYTAYRHWKLSIWELKGDPSTWGAQLDAFYKRQPVFAMVSGISTGSWQPVHEFCEGKKIPCLFPSVAAPGQYGENYYSIYFSQGLETQIATILKHISQLNDDNHHYRIVQVSGLRDEDIARAKQFEGDFRDSNLHDKLSIQTIGMNQLNELSEIEGTRDIVVSWMPIKDLDRLNKIKSTSINRIYFASNDPYEINIKTTLRADLYFVHPYTLPTDLNRALLRQTSWARIHHLSGYDREVSANSYYAVTTLNRALKHLRSNFSRDYLIERIEHMLDNNVFNSVYPHLSLGPGQRFASKGCYIVGPLRDPSKLNIAKNAQWIIP